MAMFNKLIAGFIILTMTVSFLKGVLIWGLIIVGVLILIRLCADLFWKGKDEDWW